MSGTAIVWTAFFAAAAIIAVVVMWGLLSTRPGPRRGEGPRDRYLRERSSLHSPRNRLSERTRRRRSAWSAGAGFPIGGYVAGGEHNGHDSHGGHSGCGGGCGGGGGGCGGGCGGGGGH